MKLSGVLDEDNELNEVAGKLPAGGTIVIDLGEIERINSCGVRDWVNWLTLIESAGVDVVLAECSPAVIAQINLVSNFTGNGSIKSFYVPYFCSECDEEKVLLNETDDMGPPPHEPPICRCDECDLVMDFDDMPDSYFAFLSKKNKVAKPAKVQSVLNEFSAEPSRIRSRLVANKMTGSVSSAGLPRVPSLPSSLSTGVGSRPGGTVPGSRPGVTGTGAGRMSTISGLTAAVPAKSGGVMTYVLVAAILAVLGGLVVYFL